MKSALFHTARPVLMCPAGEQLPVSLGARVAIAWNGSLEATRAVAMNLDIFARAEDVAVLVANESGEPGTSAEDLLAYLGCRGVAAHLERFRARENVGRALLEQSRFSGADLLVMGAYTHSRVRRLILGGVTKHVLSNATMPVLMGH